MTVCELITSRVGLQGSLMLKHSPLGVGWLVEVCTHAVSHVVEVGKCLGLGLCFEFHTE